VNFPALYFCVLASAFGATFASLPLWRMWAVQSGLVDDPGHRKIHVQPVPLAGGLAVLTGLLLPVALGSLLAGLWPEWKATRLLGYGLAKRETEILAIFAGAVAMTLLGWLDDKYELSPPVKFAGQIAAALLVAFAGVRITLFVPSLWFSYGITVLWIVTVTNAFNFMDNMNGLCSGLGAIGAWFLGWSAASQGQYLVALLAALSCGALAGILPYNFPRASVFLGDAGSHLTGYWMAVLAILPHFHTPEQPGVWAVFSPLLILIAPLGDLVCVVWIRWRLGKPFYIGDNNHLSHRLARRGWSRPDAVLIIWLLACLGGTAGFWLGR
jgi:UDP-GlcNAc:undecaprenyl-phosphate/decaprenyl-phosphate GlcNAc-1-phosphate transferase